MSLSSDAPSPRGDARALRAIADGLFRDWRAVAVSACLVMAAACGVALLVKPQYTAEATLLVPLSPDYAARAAVGSETAASPIMLEKDAILKSEVEILTSPSLARATIESVGLARLFPSIAQPGFSARMRDDISNVVENLMKSAGLPDRRRPAADPLDLATVAFAKSLKATPDKIGNLIAVSFRNADPAVAAEAVNTLVARYLTRRAALFSDVQSPAVEAEANMLRARADAAGRAVAAFKAQNNIADHSLQRDLLLRQRADIVRDRQIAEADGAQAKERVDVLRHELDQAPKDVVTYGGAQQLVRHGRPNVIDALEIDRARARQTFEAANARVATDDAQVAAVDAQIKAMEANAFELARLERERTFAEDHYAAVAKTLDARRFQEDVAARKAASVRVIEPASPPVAADARRLVILAAGVLLAIFAGVLAAVLAEVFRRGFVSPDTLERALGLPVLATIPVLDPAPGARGAPRLRG
ncbi:GumC family protein [Methylocella sp.]|uniref:GumC family protein n=1 Tax=Methylocella sp. TaxID=1978226 RepID=UPI003784064B